MKERTEGAWIIHHTKKLQEVTSSSNFDEIQLAGKCGLLLSSLSASEEESTLDKEKVNVICDTLSINKRLELPTILGELKNAKLIDVSASGGVSVLGITTSNVLSHTSGLFNESTDDKYQKAVLELSNYTSNQPIAQNVVQEYIGDTFKLDSEKNDKLFNQAEEVGLIDYEIFDNEKTYFNSNLFKKDSIVKTSKVLSSLNSEDSRKITELDELLNKDGCITYEKAIFILGDVLLSKLQSIAMYDFNEVSNSNHSQIFLTKPSSFAKFGNPFEDDALDLAKAFISSLMYGMKISTRGRGQIVDYSMLINTLNKLLRGYTVGPCTAIGQDYQILEFRRVVKLVKDEKYPKRYHMKLLKYDIAQLALDVIEKGDLADQATLETNLSSSSVTRFSGPEETRMKTRQKRKVANASDVGELLRTMRD